MYTKEISHSITSPTEKHTLKSTNTTGQRCRSKQWMGLKIFSDYVNYLPKDVLPIYFTNFVISPDFDGNCFTVNYYNTIKSYQQLLLSPNLSPHYSVNQPTGVPKCEESDVQLPCKSTRNP